MQSLHRPHRSNYSSELTSIQKSHKKPASAISERLEESDSEHPVSHTLVVSDGADHPSIQLADNSGISQYQKEGEVNEYTPYWKKRPAPLSQPKGAKPSNNVMPDFPIPSVEQASLDIGGETSRGADTSSTSFIKLGGDKVQQLNSNEPGEVVTDRLPDEAALLPSKAPKLQKLINKALEVNHEILRSADKASTNTTDGKPEASEEEETKANVCSKE